MKKYSITLFFLLISMTALAQDALEPIDSTSTIGKRTSSTTALYKQELQRLLVPQNAAFWMQLRPSFHPESSIAYDSTAHALIYTKVDKSIWNCVYNATNKTKKIRQNSYNRKDVPRKKPRHYHAPNVVTYTLVISDSVAQKLRSLWQGAVLGAKQNTSGWIIVDGTTWEFCIDGKHAKTKGFGQDLVRIPKLLNLMDFLIEATQKGNTESLLSKQENIDNLISLFPLHPEEGRGKASLKETSE